MIPKSIRKLALAIATAGLIAAAFATPALATSVTTESADHIGATMATLHGTVNTEGVSTTYGFEYGTSTKYGSNTGGETLPAGSGVVKVSAHLYNLTPNTTYHLRLDALGKTLALGKDVTFTTANGGKYLQGSESSEGSQQPKLNGNSGGLVAVPGSSTPFKASGLAVTCSGGGNAISSWTGPSASFSTPLYFAGCEFMEEAASIKMNGCQYAYQIANAGPPYTGTVGITCPEGKKIEIVSIACTVKIPAQSPASSVSYDEGSRTEGGELFGTVTAAASASGLTYEKAGGPLCFYLTGSGTFNTSMTILE